MEFADQFGTADLVILLKLRAFCLKIKEELYRKLVTK